MKNGDLFETLRTQEQAIPSFLDEARIAGLLSQARSRKWRIVNLYLHDLSDQRAVMKDLAVAFQFPSYFGGNWDAVDEVLRDLDWLPAAGYLVVVEADESCSASVSGHKLIGALHFAAEFWRDEGVPFFYVVRSKSGRNEVKGREGMGD